MTDLRKLAERIVEAIHDEGCGQVKSPPWRECCGDDVPVVERILREHLHQPTTSGVESTQTNDRIAELERKLELERAFCQNSKNRLRDVRQRLKTPEGADITTHASNVMRELTDLRNVRDDYLKVADELNGVRKTMNDYADVAEEMERERDDARLNMGLAFRERDEARAERDQLNKIVSRAMTGDLPVPTLSSSTGTNEWVRLDDETRNRLIESTRLRLASGERPTWFACLFEAINDLRDGKLGGEGR